MNTSINENIKISSKLHQDIRELNINLENKIDIRTRELSLMNKNINDGIKYASLIQTSILPNTDCMKNFVQDYFIYWKPKINVGGDIYFINDIKANNEVIIMIIDGVGHGVSGAFVTMILKAIENQIINDIRQGVLESSPALILSSFNKSIQMMFSKNKKNDTYIGFDGGILIINKNKQTYKYAGAKTKLYEINEDKLSIFKGERKSVGFYHISEKQTYIEYENKIVKNSKLYISTDGLFDQFNNEDISFSEKRFKKILTKLKSDNSTFNEQRTVIVDEFNQFKGNEIQTDDLLLIGIEM
jgi:serine phosphatase RsbU (regulator of sigma subunit)